MDNKDMEDHTELTIEGRLSPILLMNGAEFGVLVGDRFYPAEYNERYAHTKAFGMSIFKLRAFTIRVELPYGQETELAYVTRVRADVFENGETMGMSVVIILWAILYLCERPVKTSEGCVSGMRARPMYID